MTGMVRRTICSSARAMIASTSSVPAATRTKALPKKSKDPLLAAPDAQHYRTPSGAHFIIRSPPSSVPSNMPLPSSSSSTTSSSLFPSTFVSPPSSSAFEHLLPVSRQAATPGAQLSPEQIGELQTLRRSNPDFWTRGKLANKFGVSQSVVGRLGWGEGAEARRAEKEWAQVIKAKQAEKEQKWGWKKSIAREESKRRRELW